MNLHVIDSEELLQTPSIKCIDLYRVHCIGMEAWHPSEDPCHLFSQNL